MPRGTDDGAGGGLLVAPPPDVGVGAGCRSLFVPPQRTRSNAKEKTASSLSEEYLGFGRVTLHETPELLSGVASPESPASATVMRLRRPRIGAGDRDRTGAIQLGKLNVAGSIPVTERMR